MTTDMIPYENVERMSIAIAKSGLFGVKTPEQALALMLVAQAEGLHPASAARDYDIIQGRPAKKSEAMLRSFLQNKGVVEWIQLDDGMAKAKFTHPQGGTVTIEWDMKRVSQAKISNAAMYAKYPRQMLRSRCLSEGIRTVCPMATGGMFVPEEVVDETPMTVLPADPGDRTSRLDKVIDATTVPEKSSLAPEAKKAEILAPKKDEKVDAIAKTFDATVVPDPNNPEQKRVVGKIENFTTKSGTKKDGSTWTKWGVCLGSKWYGTFSNTQADLLAKANADEKEIQILFDESIVGDRKYNNIVAVSLMPDEVPQVEDEDSLI